MKTRKQSPQFLLCIRNEGCDDLELRKLYQVERDASVATEGYVRVIDESGEDYLYPADFFVEIALPAAVAKELALPA